MAGIHFRDIQTSRAAALIFVISAATIGGAWIFQAMGYPPCELCLSERIPYYVGVPVAGATLILALRKVRAPARLGFILLFVIFACSAGFGVYHAGVEWHFWQGPTACTGSTLTKASSMQEFLHQLQTQKIVRCDAVAIRVFGLSLAAWNALISAGLAVLAVWSARK